MVWDTTTRPLYERHSGRYASDVLDAEWALIAPIIDRQNRRGRPRKTDMREVWNATQYIVTTGCQWRMLPKDFPPVSTVQYYFYSFRDSGIFDIINDILVTDSRITEGREVPVTAGIIDSQSVKTTESGGPRGYDAGKKTKGRKRHIITDTLGHVLAAQIHPANIQDRDGAPALIADVMDSYPGLECLFADGGYAGPKLAKANAEIGGPDLHIIRRSDKKKGFVVLPRRWVVERTFAWLGRCRRLAKDVENSIASAESWLLIASIRILTRKIARISNN